MSSASPSALCLGFLSVIENAEPGFIGGYLILNSAGRPLEFHCTAPVKPTRTQHILYGPTLLPFLQGEQIGQTLLKRSKLAPLVVFTDSPHVLAARDFVDVPLLLVLAEGHSVRSPLVLARNEATSAAGFSADEQKVREAWPTQADQLDLLEPFQRIREALDEAQKSARQAA